MHLWFVRERSCWNNHPSAGAACGFCRLLKLDGFELSSSQQRPLYTSVFPFTHHRVTLQVFRHGAHEITNEQRRWFRIRSLDSIPIPSPHRRAIQTLITSLRRSPIYSPQQQQYRNARHGCQCRDRNSETRIIPKTNFQVLARGFHYDHVRHGTDDSEVACERRRQREHLPH